MYSKHARYARRTFASIVDFCRTHITGRVIKVYNKRCTMGGCIKGVDGYLQMSYKLARVLVECWLLACSLIKYY